MLVAVGTGIAPSVWLADTRALFTAAEILIQAEQAKKRRRG